MWFLSFQQLTEDQQNVVNASLGSERNRVILGPPGSGKTLVLIHRLLRAQAEGKTHAKLIVRNRAMKHFIQSGLASAGLPGSLADTADSVVLTLFRRFVKGAPPRQGARAELDWPAVRTLTLEAITKLRPSPIYDACFVDEAQDLPIDTLKILKRVSSHVTVAMDPRQGIYPDGSDVDEVRSALGTYLDHIKLLKSYRCTPRIVELASEFLPPYEAEEFRSLHLLATPGNETPHVHFFDSYDNEIEVLAQELVRRSAENYSCAVLLPSRTQATDVARALRKRGVRVSEDVNSEFGDLIPEVLTYHQAKGISVDAVFLPQLTNNGFYTFRTRRDEDINRILFVGITRASRWVWMSTRRGDELRRSALRRVIRSGRVKPAQPEPLAVAAAAPQTTANPANPANPMDWVF